MMLAKRNRGLRSDQISELFQDDSLRVGNRFLRLFARRFGEGSSQFAVLVPSKYHKSAVLRNRVKRKVFAQLSVLLEGSLSDWTVGWRVAILVKSSTQNLSPERVQEYLKTLFQQLEQ